MKARAINKRSWIMAASGARCVLRMNFGAGLAMRLERAWLLALFCLWPGMVSGYKQGACADNASGPWKKHDRKQHTKRITVMDNTKLAELGLATREASVALPVGFEIKSRTGKVTGTRVGFVGQQSATTLREMGRGKGLKGAKLRDFVNASLTGNAAKASAVLVTAFVAHCHGEGFVFTHADVSKAGSSLVIRGAKPVVKAEKQAVVAGGTPDKAMADEMARLRAEIAALKGGGAKG